MKHYIIVLPEHCFRRFLSYRKLISFNIGVIRNYTNVIFSREKERERERKSGLFNRLCVALPVKNIRKEGFRSGLERHVCVL